MTESEYERFTDWRKNHPCTGHHQVEITIVPDPILDLKKVRCFGCGEVYQITDFSEA